jgi:Phosphoesterase family
MRFITRIVLIVALAVTLAQAQTNNLVHVQHVIIVIQENRTPDNLFQQDQTLINNGAHIVSQGLCLTPSQMQVTVQLLAAPLGTCWDTDHSHSGAWTTMWSHGAMNGACQISVGYCGTPPPLCSNQSVGQYCPAMTYVQNTVWNPGLPPPHGILDPYFQIANQYGWANYMFQTNQGPSFPAHQFLFSGTSAPIQYGDLNDPCKNIGNMYPCWEWFDAGNVNGGSKDKTTGCIADAGRTARQIDPKSVESLPPNPLGFSNGYPCYDHPALSDLLTSKSPQNLWKYYARSPADLWNAPTAINHICMTNGGGNGGTCTGTEWQANVGAVLPTSSDAAPFLTDIANCNLPDVSWVIPDGNWSDHNDNLPGDGGPSWVAAIVNAIGQDKSCDGGSGYWSDTVILITWDDWGGLYDDVVPPDCPGPGPCTGYSNLTGAQYVYGFRVPLLVVSAYTKQVTPQGGYISGPQNNPQCAPPGNYYCHDFGSILNFIEYAFGQGGQSLGEISPNYPYADALVMDTAAPPNNYSLHDFFDFTKSHSFTPITGAKYPPTCFHTPLAQGCFTTYPLDPDNDATESD